MNRASIRDNPSKFAAVGRVHFQAMSSLRWIVLLVTFAFVTLTGALAVRYFKGRAEAEALAEQEKKLYQRFEKNVWPLLTKDGDKGCAGCHDSENASELHFFADPENSYTMLVEKGYFKSDNPDSLLSRITTKNTKKRMPKGKGSKPWPDGEVKLLNAFAGDLQSHLVSVGKADEKFPTALLAPYHGVVSNSMDNQFITYRQLRGKIETIFGESWRKGERDLFAENVAMFGGADFKERFNETSKASATFLSGLELGACSAGDSICTP